MSNLPKDDLHRISLEVSRILDGRAEELWMKSREEREKLIEEIKKKDPPNYFTWLKHPLLLIISTFLFTGILGGVLNYHIQHLQIDKEYQISKNEAVVRDALETMDTFLEDTYQYIELNSRFHETYRFREKEGDTLSITLNKQYKKLREAKVNWLKNAPLTELKFDHYFSKASISSLFAKIDTTIGFLGLVTRELNVSYNTEKKIDKEEDSFKESHILLKDLTKKLKLQTDKLISDCWQEVDNISKKDDDSIPVLIRIALLFVIVSFILLAIILLLTKLVIKMGA